MFQILQNENSRFWSVFQLYKISKNFLKHIWSLQSETTRRVYKNNEEKVFDSYEIKIAIKSTLKRPRMINTNNETLSINPSNDAMMIDTLNKFIIRCLLSGMIYVLYG